MPMDFRWGCQDLKPHWRRTLEKVVLSYKREEKVYAGTDISTRHFHALQHRHYVSSTMELKEGYGYRTLVTPTRKALALWVD